jgi:predicted ABC-type ATPase
VKLPERPILWIVAGPNGSGKSSLYGNADISAFDQSVWIINPDLLTARIQSQEGLPVRDANIAAVTRIEAWLDASIETHQTVGVETVLSTPKYRRLVNAARAKGYEFRFIYIVLDSVERNIERVAIRVKKGGHDVPEESIRKRWGRSLEQMPWFLAMADRAWIFDNSGEAPALIGQKSGGVVSLDPSAPDFIRALVQTQVAGQP